MMGASPFSNADRKPTSQPERVNPIFVTECCTPKGTYGVSTL
jgi:hypothetical protein